MRGRSVPAALSPGSSPTGPASGPKFKFQHSICSEKKTDREKRAWLDEEFVALVEGAPAVGQLGAVALPRLQVHRRPDHVEQRENHKTDVLARLVLAAEEHLK
jgi:hypothetical protein